MVATSSAVLATEVAVLLAGFAYASVSDLRTREVSDRLWQLLGVIGLVLGVVAVAPGGIVPIALWTLVGAFTLEHVFAWDELLGERRERSADLIEAVVYAVVILLVAFATVRYGVSATGVPWAVIAVLVSVLFARALFEFGVLYGGADAKALMIASVLVPTFTAVVLPLGASFSVLLEVVPFSVDLLMDAALLSIAIPLGLAVRNLVRGEFRFPDGFTGYQLPVEELPRRYVWLRDPLAAGGRPREDLETSEEDQHERERISGELRARGVARVWVTPQIPFLVLMTAGAVAALLAGNLVLDLITLA